MGTNYYAKTEPKPTCECCGRGGEVQEWHVGKQSAGWAFTFRAHPNAHSFEAWKRILRDENVTLEDEYGQEIDVEEFIQCIPNTVAKAKMQHYVSRPDEWLDNEGYYFLNTEFC